MKTLTLCLIMVSSICLSAQFQTILSEGDSLRREGELQSAIKAFKESFNPDSINKTQTYNLACALALDGQTDSAFHYLDIALKSDSTIRPLSDPDFYFLTKDERWDSLETALIQKTEAKYEPYENIELSKELWRMHLNDQAFYTELEIAEKKGYDQSIIKALWELKHQLNKDNVNRLIEIIDEHGWPKRSVYGYTAASACFLIIQHAELEIQEKYLPLIKQAAEEEEASWRSVAMLIDRINIRNDKPQVYGSQIGKNEKGEFYVLELEDPEYVNFRREQVGLGPIEDYVAYWDIEWTVEQKGIEPEEK